MISAEIKNQKENIILEASFGVSFSWNVSQMKFLTFSTCISWKSKPKQAGSKPHISDQLDPNSGVSITENNPHPQVQ